MVSMAAGLAITGKNVYVYSIVPFVTMRPFEQIRLDICYHNLPVKLVSVGGGYGYGALAGTHHGIEDVAILRALPGMTVVSPANNIEARSLLIEMHHHPGPSYLRLAKKASNGFYPAVSEIKLGKIIEIYPSNEVMIVTSGQMLDTAVEARDYFKEIGIDVGVASCPTIKPLDHVFFEKYQGKLKVLITLEEHNVVGGLGEAVARLYAEMPLGCKAFKAIGVNDVYLPDIGSQEYLRDKAGLSSGKVIDAIKKVLLTMSLQ